MTLKRNILILGIALFCNALPAQTLQEAEQAYQSGNYTTAAEIYEQLLQQGNESFALYYNLGNTYYRLNSTGKAILNYERALRIKPSDSDTRENLALAESHTTDRIASLPQLFLVKWYNSLVQLLPPRGWRIILLCIVALLCAAIVALLLSADYTARKRYAVATFITTLLLLIATTLAISSSVKASNHNQAIVTQQTVVVKGAPEHDSTDKFILHEGTKVKVDETLSGWHKIRLADGSTGWVVTSDIEII